MSRFIGLIGIAVLLLIAYVFSDNRKKINWRLVITGIGIQVLFALFILKVPVGQKIFSSLGNAITGLLDFTKEGTSFLFGSLADSDQVGFVFALSTLPTIIFFSALMGILYYLGIMQFIIKYISLVFSKILGTSGAESLNSVGNIFLGQTEAPLLIKPYISKMTKSEIMAVMTGGMATVAGGVMAGYIAMGIDASQLLAASIMAAPAGLVFAKILVPETETPETIDSANIDLENNNANVIDAAATGASEGLQLALNVGAMLIAFVALIALVNFLISWVCGLFGAPYINLDWILGRLFSPIAFLMGIPGQDVFTAGSLLGQKLAINEFVAYAGLSDLIKAGALAPRTISILTFALCGFANFSSIAIQIAGIGGIAPDKKGLISKLGLRALLGGSLATIMTATIAGLLI